MMSTCGGRTAGSGSRREVIMGIKEKYTFKLVFGILFVGAIAYLGYWLLAVYKVENIIGRIAIIIFMALRVFWWVKTRASC